MAVTFTREELEAQAASIGAVLVNNRAAPAEPVYDMLDPYDRRPATRGLVNVVMDEVAQCCRSLLLEQRQHKTTIADLRQEVAALRRDVEGMRADVEGLRRNALPAEPREASVVALRAGRAA